MPKYAKETFLNKRTVHPSIRPEKPFQLGDTRIGIIDTEDRPLTSTGLQTYADVYIELFDENGRAVEGNYCIVQYEEIINGSSNDIQEIAIPGTKIIIGKQTLIEDTSEDNYYYYRLKVYPNVIENNGSYTPPGVCDTRINTVVIDKKESAPGRKDGQVTIVASSGAGDLQYSLDGINWQTSETFNNLAGGGYTVYCKDAAGCPASYYLTVDTVLSLLVSDPSVMLNIGNVSRWSAAFNPIVFTYQRRDLNVTAVLPANYGSQTSFKVNGALSTGNIMLTAKDKIYVNAGYYKGVYDVYYVNQATSEVWIDLPYTDSLNNTGFININKFRPYYEVLTQITYQDTLTGLMSTINCVHRPNTQGLIRADISNFLQSLLQAKDDMGADRPNSRDYNLGACYHVKYTEGWQDPSTGANVKSASIAIDTPYYVTYSARQLGDSYGGNMAAYVPFKQVDAPSKRARWLTDFAEPVYSAGYPFDIGFIYGDDLAGLNLYAEITALDVNRNPLGTPATTYLLNEDGSFLLQQDSSKLVIVRPPVTNKPFVTGLAQRIGVNRLHISQNFDVYARYFKLDLKYRDADDNEHQVMQTQIVRIDDAIDLQSVYLRWIGLNGAWNYYRFVYNQEITLDVQNAVILKKHVTDWANHDAIEDVISKSAGLKMKVIAEDLAIADIKGLQSLKYSPKVQMLINKNPVKWQTVVLNTATFAEYETRNGQAPFSVTFNLPALNIQTQ
ncbi:hypothetical protein [Mucilaginibacter aquatilis]|uniref:Uncharacterized protein n=1 Tax=Mucilaginibacter aquatilis TaxID=1517760 RepID=A0A6I4I4B9_9SPHI|nr:hypothetical protein [Mucilaginibacter aquatilis]MVN89607.1 hypothetical protein [Mucilaginibacter aquatilis]